MKNFHLIHYSFKIFRRFWLAQFLRPFLHNQPPLTIFERSKYNMINSKYFVISDWLKFCWASRSLFQVRLVSLRKQRHHHVSITSMFILMTRYYPDLGSDSYWSCRLGNFLQPTWSTTESAWPSGQRVGLAIRRSRVRLPLWPLAGFVLGRPEFKFSATLVNSQLVASCQLGFLILLCCIWIISF